MRRIKHAAVLIAIGWTFATPAVGQDDCLASFAVNPSKYSNISVDWPKSW